MDYAEDIRLDVLFDRARAHHAGRHLCRAGAAVRCLAEFSAEVLDAVRVALAPDREPGERKLRGEQAGPLPCAAHRARSRAVCRARTFWAGGQNSARRSRCGCRSAATRRTCSSTGGGRRTPSTRGGGGRAARRRRRRAALPGRPAVERGAAVDGGPPAHSRVGRGGAGLACGSLCARGAGQRRPALPVDPARPRRPRRADSPAGAAGKYTALSHVPEQDARPAAARPGTITRPPSSPRHLQLPADLDPRLVEPGRQRDRGRRTPYDAAVAIEQELRKIPYSLDVPTPPEGRELVSWFLFDLQNGLLRLLRLGDGRAGAAQRHPRSRSPSGTQPAISTSEPASTSVTELNGALLARALFPRRSAGCRSSPPPTMPAPPRLEPPRTSSLPPPASRAARRTCEWGMAEIQPERAGECGRWSGASRRRGAAWAAAVRPCASVGGLADAARRRGPRRVRRARRCGRSSGSRAGARRLGRPLGPGETPREYARDWRGRRTVAARPLAQGRPEARPASCRQEGTALAREVERSLFAPDAREAGLRKRPALWAALRRAWVARRLREPRAGRTSNKRPRGSHRRRCRRVPRGHRPRRPARR